MRTSTKYGATKGKTLALGLVLAILMASLMLAAKPSYASTTFTVDSTGDYGDVTPGDGKCDIGTIMLIGERCTLRAAIQEANATAGADVINFNIAGTDVHTIAPASELPKITRTVTMNGYSQPGAQSNSKTVGTDAVLKIELSGAKIFGSGLRIEAANSTVKGLVINQWSTAGIWIDSSGATGNKVTGNFIGTDASGTQDLGNTYHGVYIDYGKDNTVGGTTAGERNVISGNNGNGVLIEGAGATSNKVTGNYIGTDKNGAAPLGNSSNGVYISAPNNTVGGTTAGGRNTISGNAGSGVSIYGAGAAGNRILQNSTFSNGGLGIDLSDDGPTANDPGDTDTGPNNLQNKPVVTAAKTGALKTTINARLNSTPNRTFTVQFFSNPAGGDEGKKFIGQKSVTTDGSGNAVFSFTPAQKVGVGRTVTATATNPAGSTSEFSAPRTIASA
jgi:CSLREA domain-containing protein